MPVICGMAAPWMKDPQQTRSRLPENQPLKYLSGKDILDAESKGTRYKYEGGSYTSIEQLLALWKTGMALDRQWKVNSQRSQLKN